MHSSQGSQSHTRFYIVLITLVIGGIFLVLVMNNDGGKFGLTGSSVGLFDSNSGDAVSGNDIFVDNADEKSLKDLKSREVNVLLSFSSIPKILTETKIPEVTITFKNPGIPIPINNDYLELGAIEEVTLKVTEFSGEFGFNNADFSLRGKAKRIEVNGIGFSSKTILNINLDKIIYHSLAVSEIELEDVSIPEGSGSLAVANKLSYVLGDEGLNFYSFNGKIAINKAAANILEMEGIVQGMDVSGAVLNLDVR